MKQLTTEQRDWIIEEVFGNDDVVTIGRNFMMLLLTANTEPEDEKQIALRVWEKWLDDNGYTDLRHFEIWQWQDYLTANTEPEDGCIECGGKGWYWTLSNSLMDLGRKVDCHECNTRGVKTEGPPHIGP